MNSNLLSQLQSFNPLAIDKQISSNALLQGQADEAMMKNRLAEQAYQDDQTQRRVLQQSGNDYAAYQQGLQTAGMPKAYAEAAKEHRDLLEKDAIIKFKNAEAENQDALKGLHTSQTKAADYDLQVKQFKQHGEQAKGLKSRDDAVNWIVQAYSSPDMGPIMKQGGRTLMDYLKTIPATDAEMPQWGLNQGTSSEKIAEYLSQQKIAQGHDATSAANNAASTAATVKAAGIHAGATIKAAQIRQSGADSRQEARLTHSFGGLTPEQNDALFGEQGAVTTGRIDFNKINAKTAPIFADAAIKNKNTDFAKLSSDISLARNASFRQKAMTADVLPEIMGNMVEAGKKVGFSDNRTIGKMQAWAKGEFNDPNYTEYMTQRNDALMTIAGVMRANGMSDQAHKAEIEAASPTMSPKALDAWMTGQMKSLEPRLKNNRAITKSSPSIGAVSSTSGGVPADIQAILQKHGVK